MSINNFMQQNINHLRNDIISELESEFNSHDFIKKIAKRFEPDYVDFLNKYRGSDAFRTVNSQIAKFLADNALSLNIHKTQKVKSENVFGEIDEIQGWKKN
ncbi:MAG: hypothetical protein JXL97_03270 [Bacteroidales bacterium]|nr:hypothetical protein [Bacteroidales bacterium]